MSGCFPISPRRKLRLRVETDLGDTTPKRQSLDSTPRLLTWEPVHLTAVLSHPAQGVASKRTTFLGQK